MARKNWGSCAPAVAPETRSRWWRHAALITRVSQRVGANHLTGGLSVLVCACVLAFLAVPASATFHLVKIVEVFPGTASAPSAQYVMLQMYFPSQNFVNGHGIAVFDANGTAQGTFTFQSNVANGHSLDTILIATADAEALFGITADLHMQPVIQSGGGAVCYDVIDCVAWGSFSAPGALPVPPEAPFNSPDGLVLGMAMHRNLSTGGATTAFAFAPPAPRNNLGQTGTLPPAPTSPPPTSTPTPSPSVSPSGACAGDCHGSSSVGLDEVVTLVDIALGAADSVACPDGIPADATVDVALIIQAVNNALSHCPAS